MTSVRGTGAPVGACVPTLVPDGAHSSAAGTRFARCVFAPTRRRRATSSIASIDVTAESNPRTAKLLASSTRKVAQKVFEEGGEVALEAMVHEYRGIVRESADLLYHLIVLWYRAGIHPDQVWSEMRTRADELGIAEKIPKDCHHDSRDCSSPSTGDEGGK